MKANYHDSGESSVGIISPSSHFPGYTGMGALLLTGMTVLSLLLINSRWGSLLTDVWGHSVTFAVGSMHWELSLRLLLSESLTALFFVLILAGLL